MERSVEKRRNVYRDSVWTGCAAKPIVVDVQLVPWHLLKSHRDNATQCLPVKTAMVPAQIQEHTVVKMEPATGMAVVIFQTKKPTADQLAKDRLI
jgi:hypothetical protein